VRFSFRGAFHVWQLQAKRRNRKGGQPPKFSKSC